MLEAKRRIGFFLTLGVFFAAAAAWIVHTRVAAVEAQLGRRLPVYVAARAIPAQAPLGPADFTTILVPTSFLQPSMVTDEAALEGKVSLVPLNPGDLLTRSMLSSRFVVPEGHRAIRFYRSQTVLFDDNLLAGDRVDLLVTAVETGGQQAQTTATRRHLANLPVVESDPKGSWVGVLVREADAAGVVQMQNLARQIQLLRLSPTEGGTAR